MYVDLNITWPTSHLSYLLPSTSNHHHHQQQQQRKSKQRSTQPSSLNSDQTDVWLGVSDEERKRLRSLVDCAIRLGYSVIAFNLTIPQNLDPLLLAPHWPFTSDHPPFPDLDPRTCSIPKKNNYENTILQLSRLTMVIDENVVGGGKGVFGFSASQANYLSRYSLLAVMPLDSTAFSHACLSLSPPTPSGIDIITFDLASSPKLPFNMPLSTVSQALNHGLHFEFIYGPSTNPNQILSYSPIGFPILISSINSRKNLISGIKELIRVTKSGQGLIISSGANRWIDLRAGDDLINLCNVLGLSHEYGRKALTMNPKLVVSKAFSTRQTHKGVIPTPMVMITTTHENPGMTQKVDSQSQNVLETMGSQKRIVEVSSSDLGEGQSKMMEVHRPKKKMKKKV